MKGNIMYTKWQSLLYAVQINLMNNFLELSLLVFGENKHTNLKRYWTTFCYKTVYIVPKNSTNYNFSYNGYKALTKYI